MSAGTARHMLPLKLGRVFIVTVTETPGAVYINFSGDKLRHSDTAAVAAFLWPIVSRYEADDRVLELDGAHNAHRAARLHTLARTSEGVLLAVAQESRPRPQA